MATEPGKRRLLIINVILTCEPKSDEMKVNKLVWLNCLCMCEYVYPCSCPTALLLVVLHEQTVQKSNKSSVWKKTAWITKYCSSVQCNCWVVNKAKPPVMLIHGVAYSQQLLLQIFQWHRPFRKVKLMFKRLFYHKKQSQSTAQQHYQYTIHSGQSHLRYYTSCSCWL